MSDGGFDPHSCERTSAESRLTTDCDVSAAPVDSSSIGDVSCVSSVGSPRGRAQGRSTSSTTGPASTAQADCQVAGCYRGSVTEFENAWELQYTSPKPQVLTYQLARSKSCLGCLGAGVLDCRHCATGIEPRL